MFFKSALLKTSPYLGTLVVVLTLLGLVLVGFLAVIIARSLTKSKEEKQPESKGNTHFFGMLNEDYHYGERLPPKNSLGVAMALKGMVGAGHFSLSFLKAINFLKEHLGGRGSEYIFPWIMMIGTKESGKTSLLQRSKLNLPAGQPDFEEMGGQGSCNWWFFDRSVVLDIKGDFM